MEKYININQVPEIDKEDASKILAFDKTGNIKTLNVSDIVSPSEVDSAMEDIQMIKNAIFPLQVDISYTPGIKVSEESTLEFGFKCYYDNKIVTDLCEIIVNGKKATNGICYFTNVISNVVGQFKYHVTITYQGFEREYDLPINVCANPSYFWYYIGEADKDITVEDIPSKGYYIGSANSCGKITWDKTKPHNSLLHICYAYPASYGNLVKAAGMTIESGWRVKDLTINNVVYKVYDTAGVWFSTEDDRFKAALEGQYFIDFEGANSNK